jgi:hypothetical protein
VGAATAGSKKPIVRSRCPAGGGSVRHQTRSDLARKRADDVTAGLNNQSFAEKPSQVDKSVLIFPEPRRIRDRDHIRHVIKQPCLICGRHPSDPHHLRFAQSRALGRKVSSEFTVPLCRGHHREIHRSGNEAAWWTNLGIDPTNPALWLETHPLPTISNKTRVEGPTFVINNSDLGNAGQRPRRRTPNVETNPNGKPVAF